MADKSNLQPVGTTQPDPQNNTTEDKRQGIFDERFAAITDGFGKACEEHEVPIAIAIAIHPKETHPIVFVRGHEYDVAALLAKVLRNMKANLYAGLVAEPNERDFGSS